MKTVIPLILFCIAVTFQTKAQDMITLKSGEDIEARVEEVGTEVIKYKKFDNQEGPTYSVEKSKVFMIRYANGTKEVFKESAQGTLSGKNTRSLAPLGDNSFNFNPLGFLQFGPIIQYEKKISSNAVVAPYFRYAYLGVLTHLIWTGFDDGKLSPATFGLGMGFKGFSAEAGNSMYYGAFLDYHIAKANYDIGELYETQEKYSGLALVSNIGYRWRRTSGNYLNLGLFAGANFTLMNEERYVRTGELESSDSEASVFAMLELAFGFGGR